MTEDRKQRLAQKYAALYASSGRVPKREVRMGGGGGRMAGLAAQGKPKDTKQTVKRLVWYLSREGVLIIVGMVCLLLTTLGTLATTYMLRPIINEGIEQYIGRVDEGMRKLTLRVLALLVMYILVSALQVIHKRVLLTASRRSLRRLRKDLYDKLQKLPVHTFNNIVPTCSAIDD